MIKVTAIKEGYYSSRIQMPGDKFEIEDEQAFSKLWMVKDDGQIVEVESHGPYTVKHLGNKAWDILDSDGDVIEDGDNLTKKEASNLVNKLNNKEDD